MKTKLRHPDSQIDQDEGKARAASLRGSGHFPQQPYPCHLEPPNDTADREQITAWDCYINNWHAAFSTNVFGTPTAGPVVFPPGSTIALPQASYAHQHQSLQSVVIEQFTEDKPTIPQAEQLLRTLPTPTRPIAFEVLGFGPNPKLNFEHGQITVQFVADAGDAPSLRHQLLSHYPNSAITLNPKLTAADMYAAHQAEYATEYVAALKTTFLFPITAFTRLETDPLSVVIAAMEHLPPDAFALLQILFEPARHDWRTIRESITDPYKQGHFLFSDISDHTLETKFASPLYAVTIRFNTSEDATHDQLTGFLQQFTLGPQAFIDSESAFAPLPHALGARCTYVPGMLLNATELASLVHLPSNTIPSERLKRVPTRTRPAEPLQKGIGAITLGTNVHRGQATFAGISQELRPRHCYIAGKSGTGKSTLLLNMIKQDIDSGGGVGVLDPHGDLIEHTLAIIPEERRHDVVYFNPADTEHPPSFNIMATSDDRERQQLPGETVSTIRKFYPDAWGVRINQFLIHAIPTILIARDGTLADVRRLLVDAEFRDRILPYVKNPDLKEFWDKEFPAFGKNDHLPVLNKLSAFLLDSTLRNIICQRRTAFDFDHIINGRQIFLANLSKGLLTDRIAGVLGTFIMGKLVAATFRRAGIPERDRQPFYLFVDEFQNFLDLSVGFEQILSEARKYKLILTVANQYVGQLTPEVKQAIFGNVGTLLTFQLGVQDANQVAHEFGEFTPAEILSLERGQAIARVGGSQAAFNLDTPPPPQLNDAASVDEIILRSQAKYTKERAAIERAMRKDQASTSPKPPSAPVPPKAEPPKETPEFMRPDDLDDDFVF